MFFFVTSKAGVTGVMDGHIRMTIFGASCLVAGLKFIHLSDSRQQPARGEPGYDKLYKVRPLLNLVVENFKSMYTPTQSLSIDESMVGFKGRLAFLQYMPKKPHKWGMKGGSWQTQQMAMCGTGSCTLARRMNHSLLSAWLTGWYLICLMMTGSRTRGTMSTWITSIPALHSLETCVKKDLRHAERSGLIDKAYLTTSGQQS